MQKILNGDCYSFLDEDNLSCNCSCKFAGQTMLKVYMLGLCSNFPSKPNFFSLNLTRCKILFQGPTHCKTFISDSDNQNKF